MNNLIRTNAKVLYNKKYNSLDVFFYGFIAYEELIEVCEHEFRLIEYYKIKKCLINLREIHIYPPGGEEFIKTRWFPKIIGLKIERVAFVVPDDLFAKLSMQQAHSAKEIPLTTKHFTETGDANEWLHQIIHDD